jgi:large subunit ribosomal protein L5
MNPMRQVGVEKITLNIGAGKDERMMKKAEILLKKLSSVNPIKTTAKKRLPAWGLRPGLPIGMKVTIRGTEADELLQRLLKAKSMTLNAKSFTKDGQLAFGIAEYIDVPGLEYDPDLKIIGFEVAVSLARPGYRVQRRKFSRAKVGAGHKVNKEDAIGFMQEKYGVVVE